jgi:HAE1 family hydrophobic/amphiphilic exporter-1
VSPYETDRTGRIVSFSLRRPIAVTVLLAGALVLGLVATLGIPVELIPRGFSEPFLRVFVPWRDAPAPEVLDKIVRPLEEELATVGGVDRIFSSSQVGIGRVFMRFKQGTDMDVAYREVRDRVERARRRLPEDVERVFIRKDDDTGFPIYVLGLSIDDTLAGAYDLIQNEIVLRLERIDGVASVTTDGLVEREILIELDRERAAAAGINIWQLAAELGNDNFTMASGQVRAADRKLLLRSQAIYDDLEAIERRPVSPTARLGDIATVRYDLPDWKFRVRAMGRPAVAVIVRKEGDANTLEVTRRVEQEVERFRANPRLVSIETLELFSQRQVILESLSTLVRSGEIGALFAVAVLFFFLRRVRMTMIITLSIPLSLLVALTVMYLAGETLNIITLLALMISVGLLVDNSVVVAENIFRLHREGMMRREACVRGASQIALAIIMATLTTVIVFLPASLVEGEAQFFLLRLSVPISVALVASLFVALLLIPLAVYLTLPAKTANGGGPRRGAAGHERLNTVLRRAYDATFGRMNDAYGRLLERSLRRRAEAVLLLAAAFVGTIVLFNMQVEFVGTQKEERGGFDIDVDLPPNTSFRETEQYFLACEKVIAGLQEELDLAGYFLFHRTTGGRLEGWFKTPRTNDLTPSQVTERVLAALPEKAGAELYSGDDDDTGDEEKGVFAVRLYSDDYEELERIAGDLEKLLVASPGVLGAKRTADRPLEELALVVDRERALAQGVSPRVVAGTVGYALRGQALPRATYRGRQIPVRVRFAEEDRSSLDELGDFAVPTADGGEATLGALTDVRWLPTSQQIFRRDRKISRTVSVELAEEEQKETRDRLSALVDGIELPEGVSFEVRAAGDDEALQALLAALLFSILLIYLLMAFLFESFVLPLSIVTTMPLAFLGVAWAHVATGYDIDFLGVVGIVLLVGVVVNNGIVLIDYVHRLRASGYGRAEALALAAHRRFRPILMTALTTICGMLPLLAGGRNSIGFSYTSFGLTLVGGMSTATLLTLLVVPVFYTLFDDLRSSASSTVGWLVARARALPGLRGAPASPPAG